MRRQRRTSVGRLQKNKVQKSREDRERDTHKQVQALIASVNERVQVASGEYTKEEAMLEFDDAKRLAFTTGQAGAAVAAIMGKCKLQGLIIDRSAQLIARADGSNKPQTIDDLVEDMRETLGPRAAQKFVEALRTMGIEYDSDEGVIDGQDEKD
jgi:putative sterol carrier protein